MHDREFSIPSKIK